MYFTRAVELPSFELIHAVVFACLIVVASMDASSQLWAISINANIPIAIWFFYLEKSLWKSRLNSSELTSHWQIGLSQSVHPSKQLSPHGQAKIKYKIGSPHKLRKLINSLPFMHSVSSLIQLDKQVVSVESHERIHWRSVASHLSVQISLRSSTLNKKPRYHPC